MCDASEYEKPLFDDWIFRQDHTLGRRGRFSRHRRMRSPSATTFHAVFTIPVNSSSFGPNARMFIQSAWFCVIYLCTLSSGRRERTSDIAALEGNSSMTSGGRRLVAISSIGRRPKAKRKRRGMVSGLGTCIVTTGTVMWGTFPR